MPDQATNTDIEDVLSSIRRLVTMGDRAQPAPANRAESGALVLTPALRIARDASVPPQMETDDAAGGADGEAADDVPEAGVATAAADPADEAKPLSLGPFAADDGADDEDDAPAMPPAATLGLPDRSMLEATIAELEAAVTRQVQDWEPDGSEAEPVMDWAGAEASEAAFISSRAQRRAAAVVPPDAVEDIRPSDDAAPVEEVSSAEVAAVAAPPASLDMAPEAPAPAAPQQAAVAPQLDEAALRRLVAEVLREELAGELGERITRNVRRLVRREIHRSFSGDLS
ncbi:hypothetical protein [Wenxinia marina]|uniref:Uncharacterized protein n=1 Tax=Wenxinia marina DSM 24838 TaxID=1123501 RepID=A0A0D0Q748_9RHOB|nr:hypothetical protein [Wenxinia marina]KIQ68277.1 hypothetical protein Wenmar_03115 [Wenxinia marina DSM 24838]GGL79371.1 hypothetical protein GCM10011392_37270 [Wenxinia marina]